MHLYGTRVFEQQETTAPVRLAKSGRGQAGNRLRAIAAAVLTLAAGVPSGFSQQAVLGAGQKTPEKAASDLPATPAPVLTQPLDLRTSARDFSKPSARVWGNPINTFKPTSIPKSSFANSVRLNDLVKDGKIYLQKQLVAEDELVPKLTAISNNGYDQRIFVRGDTTVNYGRVMTVMGMLSAAGFTHIGLVTDVQRPKPNSP